MLGIQTNYHIDGCVYIRFDLDNKIGEAWLQLPNSQTSRNDIELDGTVLESGEELHRQILESLLVELRQLYPDKTLRHLFYAGCDVDNVKNIITSWERGWQHYTVEMKDGTTERYEEVPGDVNEDDFYLVKEE